MATDDLGTALRALDALMAAWDRDPYVRAWQAERRAAAKAAKAAAVASLRERLVDAHDLREAIREELADCTPGDVAGLRREFNAASARITGLNAELSALARTH